MEAVGIRSIRGPITTVDPGGLRIIESPGLAFGCAFLHAWREYAILGSSLTRPGDHADQAARRDFAAEPVPNLDRNVENC